VAEIGVETLVVDFFAAFGVLVGVEVGTTADVKLEVGFRPCSFWLGVPIGV